MHELSELCALGIEGTQSICIHTSYMYIFVTELARSESRGVKLTGYEKIIFFSTGEADVCE